MLLLLTLGVCGVGEDEEEDGHDEGRITGLTFGCQCATMPTLPGLRPAATAGPGNRRQGDAHSH